MTSSEPTERSTVVRSVIAPVLLVVLAVVTVMGTRLVVVCDGDPRCFVVAGARFTDPAASGLPVLSAPQDDGYDGQFFWRLSRSPDELGQSPVHGVVLDTPIRVGRPAYPVVVWAASAGGRAGLVAWVLIGVNVVLTGLLSLLLAVLARQHGVAPWTGGAAALWPGLLFAVGRDLSEPGSALLLVAGLTAVSRARPGLAGVAWAGAVLWREQALVVPAAYGCWWLITLLRSGRPGRAAAGSWPWVLPLAALVTWQGVAAAQVGELPLLSSGAANVVLPLSGLAPEVAEWVRLDQGVIGLVWLVELAVAAAVATSAVVLGLRSRRWEVLAVLAGSALLLSASSNVWSGPAHLRYATDLIATSWFVLVTTRSDQAGRQRAGRARSLRRTGDVRSVLVLAQVATATAAAGSLLRGP